MAHARLRSLTCLTLALTASLMFIGRADAVQTNWDPYMEKPIQWFHTDEAKRIAQNILLYQRDNGGWPKEGDETEHLGPAEAAGVRDKKGTNDTTIDNETTTSQMRFLARVIHEADSSADAQPYRRAFDRGLQFLLEAQYDNGGWPQYYPLRKDYSRHITYNDDAMGDTLYLLRDIAEDDKPFGFVPQAQRQACATAFKKGIGCILKTQVKMNGHLTGWCAQHDEKTLEPAKARSYELPSLSGQETVPIVELLMSLKDPPPAVVRSVQEAVAWFNRVKIHGIDTKKITNDQGKPDVVVVKDDDADPIWARFYELDTNRPMFSGRDGVKKYKLSEIERERRAGYSWYTRRPLRLLKKDYPKWQQENAPDHNVLADD